MLIQSLEDRCIPWVGDKNTNETKGSQRENGLGALMEDAQYGFWRVGSEEMD